LSNHQRSNNFLNIRSVVVTTIKVYRWLFLVKQVGNSACVAKPRLFELFEKLYFYF